MCTVIVQVPRDAAQPTRMLAVRDEDPHRPWDAPGVWWPDTHPAVVGVRDRRANGAWLAENPAAGRLAVIVNRNLLMTPDHSLESRGDIVLSALAGKPVPERPRTAGFNLIEVAGPRVQVTTWDGERLGRQELVPGLHMIAHDDVDDPRTPRIARWLPEFRLAAEAPTAGLGLEGWSKEWVDVLDSSSTLSPDDDEAIIRDNRSHGYPTLSLLVCLAEVHSDQVSLATAVLDEPGEWQRPPLVFV